jgi:hypothetical protein
VLIRQVALLLARQTEPSAILGKNWVYRFLQRHPELSTGRNKSSEKSRILATIPRQLEGWYTHLAEIIRRYSITYSDIWNIDEIGYQMGHSQKEQVVFSRATGPPISIASSTTGWVSVLECISASGESLMPLVIHRGKSFNKPLDSWFPTSKDCPNWRFGFTEKGWTSNEYSLEWLTQIFLPNTRRGRPLSDTSFWRLLILDGHRSHATGEFIYEYLTNQVSVAYLLPHTSHLYQPCDLGPFSHLKAYFSANLKNFILSGDTQITRAQFNVLYYRTRQHAMIKQYIAAGWRRTGLYPFYPQKVLERDEVAIYRQISRLIRPPQTRTTCTPNGQYEARLVGEALMAKTSRSGKLLVRQLLNAYEKESSVARILFTEIKGHRKRGLDEEESTTAKRLKKQDQLRTWGAQEVLREQGYTNDEIDVYLAALPNRDLIFEMGEE